MLTHNGALITKVILFGSRALGTADPDSDFDLLVVEAGQVSKRAKPCCLREALRDLPSAVDVWVMSEEKFQETKQVIGGVAYPAHKHGIVLYEKPF